MLLLFRQCGSVVSDTWVGSAGGHFEENELNDPKACVLRELKEELGISGNDIRNLLIRLDVYVKDDREIVCDSAGG